jgi:hypothetical protein
LSLCTPRFSINNGSEKKQGSDADAACSLSEPFSSNKVLHSVHSYTNSASFQRFASHSVQMCVIGNHFKKGSNARHLIGMTEHAERRQAVQAIFSG